jgi:hypothetical protein
MIQRACGTIECSNDGDDTSKPGYQQLRGQYRDALNSSKSMDYRGSAVPARYTFVQFVKNCTGKSSVSLRMPWYAGTRNYLLGARRYQ